MHCRAAHFEEKKNGEEKENFFSFSHGRQVTRLLFILSQPPPCCRAVLNRRFVRKSFVSRTKRSSLSRLPSFVVRYTSIAEF